MKLTCLLLAASCFTLQSCMTTYDAHGRPVQSVDPGLAAVGIIGAGLVGAAIANSNNDDHYRHHKPHKQHRPPHHGGHHRPAHYDNHRGYGHHYTSYDSRCRSSRHY